MKRFILNIYDCDRPTINVESLIELINKSEVASEVEVLQRVADKLTAKLTDGTPGSIQFIWRVVEVSTINTKKCRTGYLNYTVNKEENFKTAGVCLFATNINSEIKGDDTGDCSITEEHILNDIIAAINFANDLKL